MDRIAATKDDFGKAEDLLRFDGRDFDAVPLSFVYGGRLVKGIPAEFSPVVLEKRGDLGSGKMTTVISGRDSEGLEIVAHHNVYSDFPVSEWLFFFSNVGNAKFRSTEEALAEEDPVTFEPTKDTLIIEDIRVGEKVLKGTDPVLYHGNGDICTDNGYEMWKDPVDKPLVYAPDCGVSCFGALPYFRLIFDDCCYNVAVGWPGGWEAGFIPEEEGVKVYAKQKNFRAYLKSGETVRAPRLTVMRSLGGEDRSRNLWRRWMFRHIVPKPGGKPIGPLHCLHTWMIDGKEEFTGVTEKNQLFAIDEYIRKGLKPDVWWIDAGWYPCDGHWVVTGNWWPNPENFPEGLGRVGEKCNENDIKLLLWF